jgi:hypothetical protein
MKDRVVQAFINERSVVQGFIKSIDDIVLLGQFELYCKTEIMRTKKTLINN